MNAKLFPKPPPANPLPLNVWLEDTDRAEVGREPFFRGRDKEYKVFQKAANMLEAGRVGGGTMIFQGAPGAGKTALMQECMEAVRLHSTPDQLWVAASINPATLQSPVAVIKSLTEAANRERERLARTASQSTASRLEELTNKSKRLFADLMERGFSVGIAGTGASLGSAKPGSKQGEEGIYSELAFLDAAPLFENMRLMVFVDEAQNTPINESTKAVLDNLHRKTEGIHLVTAFFGLSDTESLLVECGISRPPDERVVNLELLTHEETSDAIKSIFESYNFTGYLGNPEIWIERLAELSQGWPQHINRVSVAACRVIARHGYPIKDELLEHVLQKGRKSKENYYDMILRRCSAQPWIYKQLAIAAEKNEGILDLDYILQVARYARTKKDAPVDDFLTNALHAGILIETRHPPGCYQIPVPSLGDYLRSLKQEPPPNAI